MDFYKTPLELPELGYSYDELADFISEKVMELHHKGHHQAYVTGYNSALEEYLAAEKRGDLPAMIALQQRLRFHGGGHINHSLFWKSLAPANKGGGGEPKGALLAAINAKYGSFDAFKKSFNAQGVALQGSGWCWLGFSKESGSICIHTTANQDPLSTMGLFPLFGIDVWEHAYYLDYVNKRAVYLENIWNVINWNYVESRFQEVIKK